MSKLEKRKRRFKKFLIKLIKPFIICQLILTLSTWFFIYTNPSIVEDECISGQIVVEDKLLSVSRTRRGSTKNFYVYSNGCCYRFANPNSENYSNSELYEKIAIGEKLDIIYTEYSVFYSRADYSIVAAKSQNDTYLNFDTVIEAYEGVNLVVMIIFIILEIILLSVFIVIIINKRKWLRLFPKRDDEQNSNVPPVK